MKSLVRFLLVALLASASIQLLCADEKDKSSFQSPGDTVTLKGKITCARCELNDSPKCHTVLVVRNAENGGNGNNQDNEQDEVYYFDEAACKKHHKKVCEQGVNGTVVGHISEKNGVKSIKVAKLAFKSEGDPK